MKDTRFCFSAGSVRPAGCFSGWLRQLCFQRGFFRFLGGGVFRGGIRCLEAASESAAASSARTLEDGTLYGGV